ncbi:hypothetical protein HNQ39_000034 [Armatimonas rosea]|uniref:Uncharacterized protein n=2 Tax=Armatimonas rosea TaxID=685828 RepID=A0A7W9W566_ARMRO|nr:hypothetical protein [Armatimonas rosea]
MGRILFFFWLLMLLTSQFPKTEIPVEIILLFTLVMLPPALAFALWEARARLVADDDGLRWRHFGRWHAARWDEIDDYFFQASERGARTTNCLRFRDGRKLDLSFTLWGDQTEFLELVTQKATQAKSSGWLLRGKEGTITGRHVFSYKSPKRTERFEADEQGVRYFDGHTLHEAAWSEVLALHDPQLIFQRNVLTLDTRDWSASFSSALKDHNLLRAMIRQYAPQISMGRLRTPPRELLIPTERDNGKRTFHYQTRFYRSMLALPLLTGISSLAMGIWLALFSHRYGLEDMDKVCVVLSGFGLLCLAIWIIELRRFKIERIIVDRESVTWIHLLGERRVFFEEIQAIEISRESDTLVTRSGERPIRWRHSLANVAELRDEINQHLSAKNNEDSVA